MKTILTAAPRHIQLRRQRKITLDTLSVGTGPRCACAQLTGRIITTAAVIERELRHRFGQIPQIGKTGEWPVKKSMLTDVHFRRIW